MSNQLSQIAKIRFYALVGTMAMMPLVAAGQETPSGASPQRAQEFPGAEGRGSVATGGQGGKVIAATKLNDSGPSSLPAAVAAKGTRMVIFRVSGTSGLRPQHLPAQPPRPPLRSQPALRK